MTKAFTALVLSIGLSASPIASGKSCQSWPIVSVKESRGWDQAALAAVRARVIADNADTFMVIQNGKIVLSAGEIAKPMLIASVRKSIISALFGQLISDGLISLDDPISKFGIEDNVPLEPLELEAKVGDLLRARSGVYIPSAAETPGMKAARPARGSHVPGSFWYYNNWDFNVLGEIYQRVTSRPVFLGFWTRLAQPLCMQDFDLSRHAYYLYDPTAPRFPAYHMELSTRDLARFGQLYLQKGRWEGTQLVPADWVAASTAPFSETGIDDPLLGGYGKLWWTVPPSQGTSSDIPADAFTADGAGGQMMTVIPSRSLVIITRTMTPHGSRGASSAGRDWSGIVRDVLAAQRRATG